MTRDEPPPAPMAPPEDRDDLARTPWGIIEIAGAVLAVLFALSVTIVTAGIVLRFVLNIPFDDAESRAGGTALLVLAQVIVDLLAVGVAAVLSLGVHRRGPRAWGLRRQRPIAPGLCLAVFVSCFIAVIVYQYVTNLIGPDILKSESNVPESLFRHPAVLPLTVLLVVFVAPVAEEIFFRGFIFNGLRRQLGNVAAALIRALGRAEIGDAGRRAWGMWSAAVVSGFLFALIHGHIGLIIPFTIIGMLFAWLVARTGSLWNAIAVHMAFNSVSVIALLVTRAGGA
ncbi:MAG: type II CAAX endopeptidase family protein [Dehalococcoidia bacterium]